MGEALWCDFSGREPEMIKRRLAVVIIPKPCQRPRLTTAVPISSTPPEIIKPWHVKLERDPYPGGNKPEVWAKCDMISVVSCDRLSGYHYRWEGRRKYRKMQVSALEIRAIRAGVLAALGFSAAT